MARQSGQLTAVQKLRQQQQRDRNRLTEQFKTREKKRGPVGSKERAKQFRDRLASRQKAELEALKHSQSLISRARNALPKKQRSKVHSARYQSPATIKKRARQLQESGARLVPKRSEKLPYKLLVGAKSGILWGVSYHATIQYSEARLLNFQERLFNVYAGHAQGLFMMLNARVKVSATKATKSGRSLQALKLESLYIHRVDMITFLLDGFLNILRDYGIPDLEATEIYAIGVRVDMSERT